MSSFSPGFKFQGFSKVVIIAFMMTAIPILWGLPPAIIEGPFIFKYKYIPLSLTSHERCKFAFTYTISLDTVRVTKYDKLRTYTISSEFFSRSKNYGSFRTVYSSLKKGKTYTYSQFPVKGILILKYYGDIGAPFFPVNVIGYAVKGDQGTALPAGNKRIQQYSSFTLVLPNEVGILEIIWSVINGLLKKIGYNNIARIIIVVLGITILFFIIKQILHHNRNKISKGRKL